MQVISPSPENSGENLMKILQWNFLSLGAHFKKNNWTVFHTDLWKVGTSDFVILNFLAMFFSIGESSPKKRNSKFKIQKLKNQVMGKVFNRQKWGEKNSKNHQISIFRFPCVAKL